MPQLNFEGKELAVQDNESVLDCLTRNGESIPFSCKAGACQSCLMQFTSQPWEPSAQKGLKETLKAQGYFLSCICKPSQNLSIQTASTSKTATSASIAEKTLLSPTILKLSLKLETPIDFIPGQFINLILNEDLCRSYSIANLPNPDNLIELHIKKVPGGSMSEWAHHQASIGDNLSIRGPAGDCFYIPQPPQENTLILCATSTGLAPLYGILKDAIQKKHQGPIALIHGGISPNDLYLIDELKNLAANIKNFSYQSYHLQGQNKPDDLHEAIELAIQGHLNNPQKTQGYVCGSPLFVNKIKKKLFLLGLPLNQIYSDAFISKEATTNIDK